MMLTVGAGFAIFFAILVTMYSQSAKTDRHARYVGIMNIASEKIARTVRGMEMSAMNVFDEVGKHLDSPEAVIAALESKTSLIFPTEGNVVRAIRGACRYQRVRGPHGGLSPS